MTAANKKPKDQFRFGIGEWYGLSFVHLTAARRRFFASLTSQEQKQQPCIPRLAENPNQKCTKKEGVCSIRRYKLSDQKISISPGSDGALRTTCPYRFMEGMTVFQWVGEIILENPNPRIVKEIGFLERVNAPGKDVGRIDMILVHPNLKPFLWCALEMQAVYFSGKKMRHEFTSIIAQQNNLEIPFPVINRRPDYRSSGHKRLMPQLQTKVPTLRRWGKKLAIIVDRNFFDAMGDMGDVRDLTSCDIVWFVVRYNESEGEAKLEPDFFRLTTLERTVEGLTGGTPIPLGEFEKKIRQKLGQ